MAAAPGDAIGAQARAVHAHEVGVEDVHVGAAVEALAEPEVDIGRASQAAAFDVKLVEAGARIAAVAGRLLVVRHHQPPVAHAPHGAGVREPQLTVDVALVAEAVVTARDAEVVAGAFASAASPVPMRA